MPIMCSQRTGPARSWPCRDTTKRDFGFAKRYGLPVPTVPLRRRTGDGRALQRPYEGKGTLVNSGRFSGTPSDAAKTSVAEDLEARGIGERKVNYRLHDWLISRQRYWGCPIPIIHCADCGVVPVPESDLPVTLPDDAEFLPTGESPLKHHDGFLHTTCPECRGEAQRENRYDGYVLCVPRGIKYRYLSPHFAAGPFDPMKGRTGCRWISIRAASNTPQCTCSITRFFTRAMRDMKRSPTDEAETHGPPVQPGHHFSARIPRK